MYFLKATTAMHVPTKHTCTTSSTLASYRNLIHEALTLNDLLLVVLYDNVCLLLDNMPNMLSPLIVVERHRVEYV